jgi:hypothetical protein
MITSLFVTPLWNNKYPTYEFLVGATASTDDDKTSQWWQGGLMILHLILMLPSRDQIWQAPTTPLYTLHVPGWAAPGMAVPDCSS